MFDLEPTWVVNSDHLLWHRKSEAWSSASSVSLPVVWGVCFYDS